MVRAFLTMITKKNLPEKIWVDKVTEFAGEFKKLCKAEGRQSYYNEWDQGCICWTYNTIPENILYRYMEDNGYKYFHKMTQFVTTLNSRRNCSIDLTPKNVKNSDFLSILYSKSQRENSSLKLDTEFASRSMTYPSGRVISHNLHKRFSKLLQFLPEKFQHTQ